MPPAKRKPPKANPKPQTETVEEARTANKAAIIAAQTARRHNPRCPICGSPTDTNGCINPACPA